MTSKGWIGLFGPSRSSTFGQGSSKAPVTQPVDATI